jgi:hypothetical protein
MRNRISAAVIETREDRLPAEAVVRLAIDVRGLRYRIGREVVRLRRAWLT